MADIVMRHKKTHGGVSVENIVVEFKRTTKNEGGIFQGNIGNNIEGTIRMSSDSDIARNDVGRTGDRELDRDSGDTVDTIKI